MKTPKYFLTEEEAAAAERTRQRREAEDTLWREGTKAALAQRIQETESLVAAYRNGVPKNLLQHIYRQVSGYYPHMGGRDTENQEEKDLLRSMKALAREERNLEMLREAQRLLEGLSGADLRARRL